MKSMRVVSAWLMSFVATVAVAHAHLEKAVPANGTTVSASPVNVVLTFSEPARLTACWIQKSGGPKQKIASLPTSPAALISVPLETLAPGTYVLSWRVVGDDGHVLPGQIQFTVSGSAAAPH
jgi:methionine-rich copper-binding protein CopC